MGAGGTQPRDSDDPRTWPVRRTESFGGVVIRQGKQGYEVAMIRPRSDEGKIVWALPKGASEPDEEPQLTAYREVLEETGIDADVVSELEPITYWFTWPADRVRYRKTVRFFLMRADDAVPTPDGFEVAEVRFVPLEHAQKEATYPSERKVLKAAAELIRATW